MSKMPESRYKRYIHRARYILKGQYGQGYCWGLHRYWYGERYGTDQLHEERMQLKDEHQLLGDGYRDGFAGKEPRFRLDNE